MAGRDRGRAGPRTGRGRAAGPGRGFRNRRRDRNARLPRLDRSEHCHGRDVGRAPWHVRLPVQLRVQRRRNGRAIPRHDRRGRSLLRLPPPNLERPAACIRAIALHSPGPASQAMAFGDNRIVPIPARWAPQRSIASVSESRQGGGLGTDFSVCDDSEHRRVVVRVATRRLDVADAEVADLFGLQVLG